MSILKRLLPSAYLELRGLLMCRTTTNTTTKDNHVGGDMDVRGARRSGEGDLLREYSDNNDLVENDSYSSSSNNGPSAHRHHSNNNNNNSNNNICITDPVKIMKWAENNPIVSAFGVWNSDNGRRTKRFMQGVVVVKHSRGGGEDLQQEEEEEEGEATTTATTTTDCGNNNNSSSGSGEGSPLRLRLKERIDRSRSHKPTNTTPTTTTTTTNESKNDIDEQHHLNMLLQSLSTTTNHSFPNNNYEEYNNNNNGLFDLSFRDRGNSSVVEAVMTHDDESGSGVQQQLQQQRQQRLLRGYQHQQQQQQRKREILPPLPPTSLSSSTRNSYHRQLTPPPPPPPGSTLLKGGGMSGPGGVSSPRRKIPLPSDLPNSSSSTNKNTSTIIGDGGSSSEYGMNGNGKRIQRRSLSLTNTSYDAYLNEHRQQQQQQYNQYPYNRQRTNSSSSGFDPDLIQPPSSQQQQQQQQYYNKPAIEWDIFLDPQLVRLVDTALSVVDDLEGKLHKIRLKRERIRQQRRRERTERRLKRKKREEMRIRMRMYGGGFGKRSDVRAMADEEEEEDSSSSSGGSSSEDELDDDEDFDLLQAHTASQVEVDRLVAQLMRRTIIAHGSMSQLVLEGLGWAPEYNFGRVVKCSREGTNLPSPQRRNGQHHHHHHLSSFSDTLSWDEEEEQRDFEALLDRRIHSSSVAGNARGGGAPTGKGGGSTTHHSKGMFMEKWLSLFAKSLTLLVRSTNSSSSGGGGTGGDGRDGNDIVKLSSSSSSVPLQKNKKSEDAQQQQLAKTKKKKTSVTVTTKPEERGLTSYLSSLFFGSDNKSSTANNESDEDSDKENGNEDDDDNSAHLTNHDMFSPATTAPKGGILRGLGCGMSLCLGMDDDDLRFNCGTSNGQTSNSVFPLNPHASHQMARDIQRINDVLGEPLRLVLDLKSRRVPPRVWSRLIDNLRSRGLLIEGIGSFDVDELRVIGKGCSYPLTPILFFHSVGDLQRACHANEVKKGDTVYFNGGSLMWKRSSIMEAAECGGCCGQINIEDENDIHPNNAYGRTASSATAGTTSARTLNANGDYSFQPYAYPRSALSDWERVQCKSTIEDYRRHFDLKIGVYVQGETIAFVIRVQVHNCSISVLGFSLCCTLFRAEFSISAEALDELTVFVNQHGDLYDQGIAFGGVNGVAVKNISGEFCHVPLY